MYYNFDTSDKDAAVAAFLVYVVWRSRDVSKFKITPETWSQVERAVKSVAKRAMDLGEFIEKLKPKLKCASIKPKWAKTIPDGILTMKVDPVTREIMELQDKGKREFMTDVIENADHRAVLDILYKKAAMVILLVRDRIERERPYEAQIISSEEAEEA